MAKAAVQKSPVPNNDDAAQDDVKLFISYSWSSENHQEWVLNLATALREAGVDVVLDKWDLKEGHDAHKFMEQMVSNPAIKKVAIICDQKYVQKADNRDGGVGTETQIITPEVYTKEDQNKFVAVIAERDGDGNHCVPVYYKSRIFIDLSDPDLYAKNFEQLLRWIYDKPLHIKPPLGKKPAFLDDTPGPSLETTALYKRALDAIRFERPGWPAASRGYLDCFSKNMENFRLQLGEEEGDDVGKIVENIEQFLPYRNEIVEVFLALALHKNTPETHNMLHRFFESLLPYYEVPAHINRSTGWDFDNFKFLVHELFLYCIASFLKYERFDAVGYLVSQHYYTRDKGRSGQPMVSFASFFSYMESFDVRGKKLGRVSYRADLLKERSNSSGLTFEQIMQADFTLYIRGCLDSLKADDRLLMWWPETLFYRRRGASFEIYARSQSKEYFDMVAPIFNVTKKQDLQVLQEAFKNQTLPIPRRNFYSFNPLELLCYESMATRA
ncbi:MAG: TIR domain-containing protein [Alphaproteobacteria bacterium]|nr:TIR domain-containing protein [Alphaproteobacteria bacterium]